MPAARVTIKFRDAEDDKVFDGTRAGGSYTNSVRYEGQFVIVTDVYSREHAYPVDRVASVEVNPGCTAW